MAATRTELRERAEDIIRLWRLSSDKSPFSGVDLFTMALLHNDEPMNENKVAEWVRKSFSYYSELRYYDAAFIRDGGRQVELPATQPARKFFANPNEDWHLVIAEARIYLQTRFEPKPGGSFPFLELPPELRNRVYEMVFQLSPDWLAALR